MKRQRGFTLLEMIVAATIMGIAIAGLMSALSTSTRNAAKLQDYDRAVQLSKIRMNELMLERKLPHNAWVQGEFDPAITGGMESGWKARLTTVEEPPVKEANSTALDRLELEVWWRLPDRAVRTFTVEGYRPYIRE